MIRSSSTKLGLSIGALVAIGALSFFVSREFLDSTTPSKADTQPPPSLGQAEETVKSLNELLSEDAKKPRFAGELGEFTVFNGEVFPDQYPCALTRETVPAAASELYFSVPGGEPPTSSYVCEDGSLALVFGARWLSPDGESSFDLERWYFIGDRPNVWVEAPEDRLTATNLNGLPTLVVNPVSGLEAYPEREAFILERAATAAQPGIVLHIRGRGSFGHISSLAEQVTN